MFKHLIAPVLVALAAVFVSPAVAQQPPGANVGTLTCKMAPSIGLIFGSRQRMACRFAPNGPNPPEAYVGVMGTIGVGVGVGANLLFGGTGRSIALQPLSVEGSVGINLSLGVSSLTLSLAQ